MNNRGQNVNPNGTPQNNQPNQGYPQQNSQYQGNGYNAQNQQNFNRNVNNQHPYQNQNSQVNNVNNQQYQGYASGQNPQNTNVNNAQFRGPGYNGQNPQFNNVNNPQFKGQGYNGQNSQFRGPGYNGQNPQFGNMNNGQFNNQNGYNNPNQFNPQFGNNNPNFNPMNRGPKMDSKMIGYITAAVAALIVVLMIFMFSSGSGKLGGGTPEEAVKNAIAATKDGDFKKLVNNIYFESDEARSKALEQFNNIDGTKKASIELAKTYIDMIEIGEVKSINENRAKVELKVKGNDLLKQLGGDTTRTTYVKKVNGRWFIEDNLF